MINIDRARIPETILEMAEHLTVHNPDTREAYIQDYLELWRRRPDDLFVLEARTDELVAFLIVTAERTCVNLSQAWAKPGIPWAVMAAMFQRVVLWAASIDRFEIRAETKRDVDALFRRFGFEEHSVNIRYQIPHTIFDTFLETQNGR